MSSILTNHGAIVALQSLKMTNANLSKAQNQISTGKAVATAKDNAAIWAIAKSMETNQMASKTIQSGLNVAEAVVATSRAGAERITGLLQEMKDLAVAASSDTADFGKINTDIKAKEAQINAIISNTSMNGINLLATDVNGAAAGTPTSFGVASSVASDGTINKITVNGIDLEAGWGTALTAITDTTTAATTLGEINTRLTAAINGAAALGSAGKRLADQSNFVSELADSLKVGVGSLVDADMEEASARLQALQTQQQLGIQSLSIANQAPQSILALFR